MVELIRQLANDIMRSFALNVVTTGNMYTNNVKADMETVLSERELFGLSKQELLEQGILENGCAPLKICGEVATVLCKIFLDTKQYRFDYGNRSKEDGYGTTAKELGFDLAKRSNNKSHLLRINNKSHSYILYLPESKDYAYLMQGNVADCMAHFTLQEWMNSKKAELQLDINEHCKVLAAIENMQSVGRGARFYDSLFDTFAIAGDAYKNKKYDPFHPVDFEYILRPFEEKSAAANVKALYVRAGVN